MKHGKLPRGQIDFFPHLRAEPARAPQPIPRCQHPGCIQEGRFGVLLRFHVPGFFCNQHKDRNHVKDQNEDAARAEREDVRLRRDGV